MGEREKGVDDGGIEEDSWMMREEEEEGISGSWERQGVARGNSGTATQWPQENSNSCASGHCCVWASNAIYSHAVRGVSRRVVADGR
jgi:hypothetical protein